MKPRLYFAAPLFNTAELTFNAELKARFSRWFDVYLPQEDGGLIVDMVANGVPREAATRRVFSMDTTAVQRCDVLLIVLDGRAVDEGACFELGYAFALGKLCVGLQTDVRRLLPSGNNPMLEAACFHIFESLETFESWAGSTRMREDLAAARGIASSDQPA